MVGHKVKDEREITIVCGGNEIEEIIIGPEERINLGVILDVVAKVAHR